MEIGEERALLRQRVESNRLRKELIGLKRLRHVSGYPLATLLRAPAGEQRNAAGSPTGAGPSRATGCNAFRAPPPVNFQASVRTPGKPSWR